MVGNAHRVPDRTPCPESDLVECAGHTDHRGWWSTRFDAQFILDAPDDLAQVATGSMGSWAPQPNASLDIEDELFANPSGVQADMLGSGDQRRFRIGEAAFDRPSGPLSMLKLFTDGPQPVVHVWHIGQVRRASGCASQPDSAATVRAVSRGGQRR